MKTGYNINIIFFFSGPNQILKNVRWFEAQNGYSSN